MRHKELIGSITCANNVLLLSDTMESLQFQIELFTDLANRERMQIHPTKTSVSIMGITQSEIQHLQEVYPFAINSVPIPITSEFTHLGVDYNLDHPSTTENRTVEARLQTGRSTTDALMEAGLCGWNGVNPITSWHIYTIYIQPKILFSLEAMDVTGKKASLYRRGVSLRTF